MIDYHSVLYETLAHYFGDEPYSAQGNGIQLNTTPIVATTIDEYVVRLIEGYVNVTIEERLERYIYELIKGDWFHQWPLVRWAYATRILYNDKASARDLEHAVTILSPLAKEEYPNALSDIAFCYCYGVGVERSYEKALCLWIVASKKGYQKAHEELKREFELTRSKDISDELRFFLVNRILEIFVMEHNVPVVNSVIYTECLDEKARMELGKIYYEHRRLGKVVFNKALLRHTGRLCWSDEENPYNIEIKHR